MLALTLLKIIVLVYSPMAHRHTDMTVPANYKADKLLFKLVVSFIFSIWETSHPVSPKKDIGGVKSDMLKKEKTYSVHLANQL
jgi:hypothetical protein